MAAAPPNDARRPLAARWVAPLQSTNWGEDDGGGEAGDIGEALAMGPVVRQSNDLDTLKLLTR